jgi:hypothetical protein
MVAPAISITRALLSMGVKAATSPKGMATLTALGFAPAAIEKAVKEIKDKETTVTKPTPTPRSDIKARIQRETQANRKPAENSPYQTNAMPVSQASKSKSKVSSFGKAFAEARKAGKKEFEYKGKKYHTRTKEEEAARKKGTTKKSMGSKVGSKPRGVGIALRGYGGAMKGKK